MPSYKPLVNISGQTQQLPAGATLDAGVSEVDVVAKTNDNAGAITVGMPVYVKSNGNIDKAGAAASGTRAVLGLVRDASISASTSGSIQTDGVLVSADWTAVTGSATLTPGAMYYLSATAGQLTTTAPSSAGQYICKVGLAIAADAIDIDTDRNGILLA